jgi:8-oxo-dGTP diphosphatase
MGQDMQVVGAIIKNQAGDFLLQQRDDNAPTYKRCWTLFGGRVEPGESSVEAIRRELEEEIALKPDMILELQESRHCKQSNGTEQTIFLIITSATLDVLHLTEGRAMAYVSRSHLFRLFADERVAS